MSAVKRTSYENKIVEMGNNVSYAFVATAAVEVGAVVEYDHASDKIKAGTASSAGPLGIVTVKAEAGEKASVVVAGKVNRNNITGINDELFAALVKNGLYPSAK